MTLTQLEYVVAVATYKSFVAAAERTYVTQPTLSMQISKLEEELNVRIFDRNKHPILPTEIGEKIVEQAKVILSESDKIHEIVNTSLGKLSGRFRIAVIPTIAPTILPKLLENYVKKYPEMRLVVTEAQTNTIIEKLKNDEIDCGLLSTPLEDNKIKEYPLFYEPLVAYFNKSEPPLKKKLISVDDVALNDLWLMNEGNCLRNQVLNLCSEHLEEIQEERPYRYESANVDTLRKMVDKNGGMTILPELAAMDLKDDAIDNIRYFESPEPVREVSIVTNEHFVKLTILQSLIDTILELVPEKMRVQKKNRRVLRIQSSKF